VLRQPLKMFQAVVVFWLLLDFAVKQTVVFTMELRETIPVWEGIFHLTYVRNYGAAFSLMQGQLWIFYLAMAALIVIVAWFWTTEKPHHWMPVLGTALVIAGALGNTLDRLMAGSVIDMFDFRVINFAIFNVADIGISVGCALFMLWILFVSGHIQWRELFSRREIIDEEAAVALAATEGSVDAKVGAGAAMTLDTQPTPRFSWKERLEMQLQKWEENLDLSHDSEHEQP